MGKAQGWVEEEVKCGRKERRERKERRSEEEIEDLFVAYRIVIVGLWSVHIVENIIRKP